MINKGTETTIQIQIKITNWKFDMKKKRHYRDHHCDLDSYSDSERDNVHGYHSMSTTHHSKHRDRDQRTSNVSQHYNGHDWYPQEKVKDMESYSHVSHVTVTAHNQKEKN